MGRGMAKNLLDKGYAVTVVAHRNRQPIDELLARGADEAADLAALAVANEIVITCMPSLAAVSSVIGGANGLIENMKPGSVLIDATTSDPALTRELGERAAARDVAMLDAPLLKGPKQAWEGTISILAGGDEAVFERCRPVLQAMASEVFHVGPLGHGHSYKICNNAVSLGVGALLSEVFVTAAKQGLDLSTLFKVLSASNANSARLQDMGPRFIEGNHSPAFMTDTALKDSRLYCKLAEDAGTVHLVGDATRYALTMASNLGYGRDNNSRMATALAKVTGTALPEKG